MTYSKILETCTQPSSSSDFGHHWLAEYANDPWLFYLHKVLGLELAETHQPFSKGSAFHAILEGFYSSNMTSTCSDGLDFLDEYATLKNVTADDVLSLRKMWSVWYDKWGAHDRDHYRVHSVECSWNAPLANGFMYHGRIDRTMLDENGRILIFDTKTTGFSADAAYASFLNGDQSRTYLWLVKKTTDDKGGPDVLGISADITYARQSVCQAQRPAIIPYIPREMRQWELNVIGNFSRLYTSLRQLEKGIPPSICFPRNAASMEAYGGKSYWAPIYREANPVGNHGHLFKVSGMHPSVPQFLELWSQTKSPDITD
jgi:hypothetical protein